MENENQLAFQARQNRLDKAIALGRVFTECFGPTQWQYSGNTVAHQTSGTVAVQWHCVMFDVKN